MEHGDMASTNLNFVPGWMQSHFSVQHFADSFRFLFCMRLENFIAFAILAYFSGWNYVNAYFSFFNVNRSGFSFDDYTIFLYSFFVLVEIPSILVSVSPGALSAVAIFVAMIFLSSFGFPESLPAALNLVKRVMTFAMAIGCLFFFSNEAGRSEALQVSYGREARRVSVTLTQNFEDALEQYRDGDYAEQWLNMFKEWDKQGALALIWRNNHETMLLVYETQGLRSGCPAETYRISNRYIASIRSAFAEEAVTDQGREEEPGVPVTELEQPTAEPEKLKVSEPGARMTDHKPEVQVDCS